MQPGWHGESVTGYLCDGDQVSVWFDLQPITDGVAELVNRDGEPLGQATSPGRLRAR